MASAFVSGSFEPVWCGVAAVAEITGLSSRQIRRLANADRIPAYRKPGMRAWKFKTAEVRRWWQAGFNGATLPESEAELRGDSFGRTISGRIR